MPWPSRRRYDIVCCPVVSSRATRRVGRRYIDVGVMRVALIWQCVQRPAWRLSGPASARASNVPVPRPDSYECVCASALIRCGPARRAASARRRHAGAGAVSWVRAGFWPVLAGGTQGGVGSGRGGGQGAAGRRPFKALLSFEAALLIAHARMLTARPYAAR